MITFNGITYPTRRLKVASFLTGVMTITIATESLQDVLLQDCEPVSDEAETIDEGIYFYVPDEVMKYHEENIAELHLDEPFTLIEEIYDDENDN